MIQRLHDSHFQKKFLLLLFIKGRFLYLFGRSQYSCVFRFNLTNFPKTTSSNLPDDLVVIKIVPFLHFDKVIPFDLYL